MFEPIIKKAIEGGWERDGFISDGELYGVEQFTVLDPLFWQALGKACGSEDPYGPYKWCDMVDKDDKIHEIGWKRNALRFHEENLTNGWSKAVEWLSELVK